MTAASDDEAVPILLSVFALTALVIPDVCVLVFELTCEVIELDALCISDKVAKLPTDNPLPVNSRVPLFHTSAASVPKVVKLRDPYAHIVAGRDVIILPIDVEAVFVLALTNVTIELEALATVLLVFPLMTAAKLDEAVLVLALTKATTELEAFCTSERVDRLPEVSPAPVSVRVA
jgi:hypothetical protein